MGALLPCSTVLDLAPTWHRACALFIKNHNFQKSIKIVHPPTPTYVCSIPALHGFQGLTATLHPRRTHALRRQRGEGGGHARGMRMGIGWSRVEINFISLAHKCIYIFSFAPLLTLLPNSAERKSLEKENQILFLTFTPPLYPLSLYRYFSLPIS